VEAAAEGDDAQSPIPSKGDRIELLNSKFGVRMRGTVFYADQLQILVKWDDGGSSSLRVGRGQFRIIDPEEENNRR